ncbi:MAG: hypothetical protein LBR00_04715, partial [Clostridiales Family XIII bacterium]|nr:hypothetical protein [Clostridiales Family XIII bacterium]
MKEIRTQDAVGLVLAHDITRIVPDIKLKETAFRKGHVVREEDVEPLLKLGKMHLYVWEDDASLLHENDAATVLADLVGGDALTRGAVREGKIELFADADGVLRVDREKLSVLNGLGEIMVASRHDFSPVKAGDKVAGTRIIPLAIAKEKMDVAQAAASAAGLGAAAPALRVLPYLPLKTAIVTTGSEVYQGLIEDGFTPVVRRQAAAYAAEGSFEVGDELVPDLERPLRRIRCRLAAHDRREPVFDESLVDLATRRDDRRLQSQIRQHAQRGRRRPEPRRRRGRLR